MDFAFSVFNQNAGLAETSQNSGFWYFFGVAFLVYYYGFFWCMILAKRSPFLCCYQFSLTAASQNQFLAIPDTKIHAKSNLKSLIIN